MNGAFLAGMLLGILGALLLNVGKGVQKQHVHVFFHGRAALARAHRRTLLLWCVGLAMTAGASIPYNLGLMLSGSPSTISSMTGMGLIGLTIYATRVIGEELSFIDGVGIALVVVGTSLLSYLGGTAESATREFTATALLRANVILLSTSVSICAVALWTRKLHGLAFGTTAGLLLGLAMFIADVGLVRAGGSFVGQFGGPHVYLAIAYALSGMVVTQVGFARARALDVVPAINSMMILTPLLLEWIIYREPFEVVRLFLVLVIVVGVLLLSFGASSAALTSRQPP